MKPERLDIRIGASVLVCYLACMGFSALGWDFIQPMPACITCLLCCMDDLAASRGASITRLKVTAVGGLCGVAVVALHMLLGSNPLVLALLIGVGVVVSLVACRELGVPAFNTRIGALTFLLVAGMLSGPTRLWYALWRFVSTLFGALVVLLVAAIPNGIES